MPSVKPPVSAAFSLANKRTAGPSMLNEVALVALTLNGVFSRWPCVLQCAVWPSAPARHLSKRSNLRLEVPSLPQPTIMREPGTWATHQVRSSGSSMTATTRLPSIPNRPKHPMPGAKNKCVGIGCGSVEPVIEHVLEEGVPEIAESHGLA